MKRVVGHSPRESLWGQPNWPGRHWRVVRVSTRWPATKQECLAGSHVSLDRRQVTFLHKLSSNTFCSIPLHIIILFAMSYFTRIMVTFVNLWREWMDWAARLSPSLTSIWFGGCGAGAEVPHDIDYAFSRFKNRRIIHCILSLGFGFNLYFTVVRRLEWRSSLLICPWTYGWYLSISNHAYLTSASLLYTLVYFFYSADFQ